LREKGKEKPLGCGKNQGSFGPGVEGESIGFENSGCRMSGFEVKDSVTS